VKVKLDGVDFANPQNEGVVGVMYDHRLRLFSGADRGSSELQGPGLAQVSRAVG
jgi:hypothetical protein